MSDPIRDAITRAIISKGDELIEEKRERSADSDGPFDFYEARPVLPEGKTREQCIEDLAKTAGVSIEEATQAYRQGIDEVRIAKSSMYQVAVHIDSPNGFGEPMVHLSIKRLDRQPIHDWRDLQKIKNAIVGDESEAIELYPADSRLVDAANQYHLWCFKPGFKVPVGFNTRLVYEHDDAAIGSKQRRFESPDAALPSRAQLGQALRDLVAQTDGADGVAQLDIANAQALIEQIDRATMIEPLSRSQRLTNALAFIQRAQDELDHVVGDDYLKDARLVSSVFLCDSDLQEARDRLGDLIKDQEKQT